MVRDGTRWPQVNKSALHAFIPNCTDLGARVGELKPLLTDIRGGRVADPDNELLGILLFELYPRNLPPSELWEYSFDTSRDSFLGTYWGFFKHGIHEKSSDDQVAALLDGLMARPPDVREALFRNLRLRELPAKLLARGLQSHGDQLAKVRLYGWLGAGIAESLVPVGDEDDIQKMRSWLEQRPEVQKALFLEGLARCPESDEFRRHAVSVRRRWYGASPPADFGLWCLEQAVSMADERPLAAEHLLEMAFQAHRDPSGNADLSLQFLQEQAQKSPRLRERLEQLLSPSPILEEQLQYEEEQRRERGEPTAAVARSCPVQQDRASREPGGAGAAPPYCQAESRGAAGS